jgi:hypothetical protein
MLTSASMVTFNTMLQVLDVDPDLLQITLYPAKEIELLRSNVPSVELKGAPIAAGVTPLNLTVNSSALDVEVSFDWSETKAGKIPNVPNVQVGVAVLVGEHEWTLVTLSTGQSRFDNGSKTTVPAVLLGVDTAHSRAPESETLGAWMNNTELTGGVYKTITTGTDPHKCLAACAAEPKGACYAWTLGGSACMLKNAGYDWFVPHPGWTSGCVLGCSEHRRGSGVFTGKTVMLKKDDTRLTLRVLADRSVIDAFAMDGRGAMTRRAFPKHTNSSASGASLVYNVPKGVTLEPPKVTLTAWPMSSGYID